METQADIEITYMNFVFLKIVIIKLIKILMKIK